MDCGKYFKLYLIIYVVYQQRLIKNEVWRGNELKKIKK